MRIEFVAADPAGNITLLIKSPVPREDYGRIARKLLSLTEFKGEQVGFFTSPREGGRFRLEMMGGEFCGNAARSAALCYGREMGLSGDIAFEISGCSGLLHARVEGDRVRLPMPLPRERRQVKIRNQYYPALLFEGIAHVILEDSAPSQALVMEASTALSSMPAVGVMFFSWGFLRPAVYVRSTDSLYFENSCASGSTALCAYLCEDLPDGAHRFHFPQPGGVLEGEAFKQDGMLREIAIASAITMGPLQRIEI